MTASTGGFPGLVLLAAPEWGALGLGLARLAGAVLLGLLLHELLSRVLAALARRTRWNIDDVMVRRLRRPGRLVVVLFVIQVVVGSVFDLSRAEGGVRQALALGTIGAITWLVLSTIAAIDEHVKSKYDITVADNLEARRVHTQMDVVTRTLHVFVVVIGVAVALMTFPRVRELGASLLASAGIAGLAIGLAARPVLENLIAGLQIAITQPIRLDDVVIVEGEWGRIEEITATYVVVKIWDERRLIVPFGRFIQQPFQNWTRTSAEILGTIFLYTDYTVPLSEVREELKRIVEGSEDWDGRVCNVQVTDANEQTMQIRALISASDSGKAWNLRVLVREKLIEFLQREHPDALPRTRVELPGSRASTT